MARRREIQPTPGESSFAEWERWLMYTTLSATDWNISQTARILGIGRSTVHRKIISFAFQLPAGKNFK
jgi:transcriptional regulator of acetoin/glycerol metabolism